MHAIWVLSQALFRGFVLKFAPHNAEHLYPAVNHVTHCPGHDCPR